MVQCACFNMHNLAHIEYMQTGTDSDGKGTHWGGKKRLCDVCPTNNPTTTINMTRTDNKEKHVFFLNFDLLTIISRVEGDI